MTNPSTSISERQAALRILDANFNRASEGLRVVEEHCRFVLNDRHLTQRCKRLRHDLTAAIATLPAEQLHTARQTEADVGTGISTPAEQSRQSLAHIAAANWQRVEQALRALEEYAKLLDPALATRLEALRYESYTLAKACLNAADSRQRLAGARLYVLLDGGDSEAALVARVRAIVAGGADALQLRDKRLCDRALLGRALLVRQAIDENPVRPLFIVNDRPDVAVLARADGVHLGQEELTVHDARQIVGPEMLVGVSTHNIEQARQGVLDGASYLGCGPTFPSGTKHFDRFPGLDFLRQVAAEISLPAFAIGGITAGNLPQVLATGLRRVAVGGAIAIGSDADARSQVQALHAALGPAS